jgi:tRNA nucleotidyltransferase (CCA-adding enzyme)
MQIYLVGGAIRDRLLGLSVRERDFVVVGATPEEMLQLGYRQVGRDFPIFLHPLTHEEYALARTQRGSSANQPDTPVPQANPRVTLQEDLARRDLTINAIAQDESGRLIDPFGGLQDLHARLLRHVSTAFADDPIRVLRVARFMARFQTMGFRVADETMTQMRELVQAGDLDHLVPERVWLECSAALVTDHPEAFFLTLRTCGALARVLPEIDRLWGVPQPERWHPEVDCGVHTMMTLQIACELSPSLTVRFAALTHDLGKGVTPADILPRHQGHETRGARLVRSLCERLRIPNRCRLLAEQAAQYHGLCHRVEALAPKTVLRLLEQLDAFRRPEMFQDFLRVCEADYRGRQGFETRRYHQAAVFKRLYEAASEVDPTSLRQLQGKAYGQALRQLRLEALRREQTDSTRESLDDTESGKVGADGRT